jgi:site-specific recombinase XerC
MILRGDPLRKQLSATSCKESRLCVPVAWSAINNAQTMRERLSYVRGFARYRQASDPRTQIPAPGLLPGRPKRARPYLYSAQEIEALLDAARHMPHRYQSVALLPWVYYCLFGLLSVTGLRLSSCVKPWAALNSAGRIDHDDCHQLSPWRQLGCRVPRARDNMSVAKAPVSRLHLPGFSRCFSLRSNT